MNLYGKGRKSFLLLIPYYIKRIFQCLFLNKYNIIYIEKELLPYMPLWMEKILLWRKKNIIIDFDDAIFHSYDKSSSKIVQFFLKNKIYKLVQLATIVITGSPYLTSTLRKYNSNTIEIPTSIDFVKYKASDVLENNKETFPFRIGWIGSKTTSVNVLLLKNIFQQLQNELKIVLVLIGFDKFSLPLLDGVQYEYNEWNATTELPLLRSCDAGIMPLEDNDFNKGKCGFKLIQYMACGLPTISTPLEANTKINHSGENLHAVTEEEWMSAITTMYRQKDYFKTVVGKNNIEIVKERYSIQANHKMYLEIFSSLLASNSKVKLKDEKLHNTIA